MARTVNLYEAKSSLSRLVEEAAGGEEIVICKAGKPKARLVPLAEERTTPRTPGLWKGQLQVSDDLDEPLPEDWWHAHSDDPDADPLNLPRDADESSSRQPRLRLVVRRQSEAQPTGARCGRDAGQ